MISFIYGGKTDNGTFKIGETVDLNRRLNEIKSRNDKSFQILIYKEFNGTKAERLFLESFERFEFSQDFELNGNDWFKGNMSEKRFIARFEKAFKMGMETMEKMNG